MYFCPNCGGELQFDIASGMMKCGNCMSTFNPAEMGAVTGAQESHEQMSQGMAQDVTGAMGSNTAFDMQQVQQQPQQQADQQAQPQYEDSDSMMNVTIYRCSQCGGEIYSTENSATGFCSFCGTSQLLESRLASVKKPEMVIPFSITKEMCKDSYLKRVKKSFLIPKEFKDPQKLERFRGIYMPYWFYDYEFEGPISIRGTKSHRSGDYIITDYYRLNAQVSGSYKGNSFDASSEFDDRISQSIAPFKPMGAQYFSPAYLTGYYADLADVPVTVYQKDAEDFVINDITGKVSAGFPGFSVADTDKHAAGTGLMQRAHKKARSAMCPVWFLSYRNKDRIAYAVVNGQTGKIASDMPVDKAKFLLTAVAAAIPIFLLLELFLTLIPRTTLGISSIFALIAIIIYAANLSTIKKQDNREDDKGLKAMRWVNGQQGPQANGKAKNPNQKNKKKNEVGKGATVVTVITVIAVIIFGFSFISELSEGNFSFFLLGALVALVGMIVSGYTMFSKSQYKNVICCIIPLLAGAFTVGLVVFKPVSDLYYYSGIIFNYIGMLVVLLGILNQYNILATRPLPQLARKGGDDRAPGR